MTQYTVDVSFRPLTQWPAGREHTADDQREHAKFKAPGYVENSGAPNQRYVGRKPIPLTQTLQDLKRELWAVGALDAVVQVDLESDRNFRQDGGIRADARVRSPAIVVSFERLGVPTVFATDHFTRWEDNLRAVVLGMESLRRLERYHIARAGDQYRGWQALPATTTAALSTAEAAMVVARRMADVNGGPEAAARRILSEARYARDAIRAAAARTHPDRGGLTDDFKLVQEAKRVLEAHHGGAL